MRGRLGPRSDVTANGARRGPRPPVRADQRDAGGGAGGVVDLCVAETAEIGRKDGKTERRKEGTWVSPLSVNDLPSFRLSVLPSHLTATLTDTATDPYRDRKSTRLNSSHAYISYAVF